jgi:hypothetical protein
LGCFFWQIFWAEFFYLSRMSFCCAAGIALCFSEERRKQCAMCAVGGKKYDRKNNEGLAYGLGKTMRTFQGEIFS